MQGRGILFVAGFASLIFWMLLFRLINRTPPTNANLALALGLLFLATAGAGTVVSWYVQRRVFHRDRILVALRQGLWLGFLLAIFGWLQLVNTLTPLIAMVLVGIIITAESLFLLREAGA